MSLVSILRSSNPREKEISAIIKSICPKKDEFLSVGKEVPFSKYSPFYEFTLYNRQWSGLIGTTFDLMSKIIINNRTSEKLTLDILTPSFADVIISQSDALESKFDYCKKTIKSVLAKGHDSLDYIDKELVEAVSFFAKLENIYRAGLVLFGVDDDTEKYLLGNLECGFFEEILNQSKGFDRCLFQYEGVIGRCQTVTYRPSYSTAVDRAFGGVSADLCIGNTLLEIKSGKLNGYRINEVAQLMAYYLCYLLDRSKVKGSPDGMQSHNIKRIAFYRSRYAQIEYFELNSLNKDKVIDALTKLNEILNMDFDNNELMKFINDQCSFITSS